MHDMEFDATIGCARFFGFGVDEGPCVPEAARGHSCAIDAVLLEPRLHASRATAREGHVVAPRARVVGVSLDRDAPDLGMPCEHLPNGLKNREALLKNDRLIGCEVHLLRQLDCVFLYDDERGTSGSRGVGMRTCGLRQTLIVMIGHAVVVAVGIRASGAARIRVLAGGVIGALV